VECLALFVPGFQETDLAFSPLQWSLFSNFFHIFNPLKRILLFDLEVSVCRHYLSSESAIGVFDSSVHSLQNSPPIPKPLPPQQSQNQNTYNVKILFHSGLRFL